MSISKREEYQNRIEEQLALWSARFDALKAHAGTAASAEIAQQLVRWHEAKEIAAAKLTELRGTAGDGWDLVKEEMEKAWHAIEVVLDEGLSVALSRFISPEEIQSLTPEQQDAILEAMVIAVVAHGKSGKDEVARVKGHLAKVPWAQPKEEILKKAEAAQLRILALANDDERRAMLTSISARLPPGPIAEKTLGMMALIMTTVGPVSIVEETTLTAFAQAFGITQARQADIAAAPPGA